MLPWVPEKFWSMKAPSSWLVLACCDVNTRPTGGVPVVSRLLTVDPWSPIGCLHGLDLLLLVQSNTKFSFKLKCESYWVSFQSITLFMYLHSVSSTSFFSLRFGLRLQAASFGGWNSVPAVHHLTGTHIQTQKERYDQAKHWLAYCWFPWCFRKEQPLKNYPMSSA